MNMAKNIINLPSEFQQLRYSIFCEISTDMLLLFSLHCDPIYSLRDIKCVDIVYLYVFKTREAKDFLPYLVYSIYLST